MTKQTPEKPTQPEALSTAVALDNLLMEIAAKAGAGSEVERIAQHTCLVLRVRRYEAILDLKRAAGLNPQEPVSAEILANFHPDGGSRGSILGFYSYELESDTLVPSREFSGAQITETAILLGVLADDKDIADPEIIQRVFDDHPDWDAHKMVLDAHTRFGPDVRMNVSYGIGHWTISLWIQGTAMRSLLEKPCPPLPFELDPTDPIHELLKKFAENQIEL